MALKYYERHPHFWIFHCKNFSLNALSYVSKLTITIVAFELCFQVDFVSKLCFQVIVSKKDSKIEQRKVKKIGLWGSKLGYGFTVGYGFTDGFEIFELNAVVTGVRTIAPSL